MEKKIIDFKFSSKYPQSSAVSPRKISLISRQKASEIARNFTKKISPVNCSMNVNSDGNNVERVIEISKRKEKSFDKIMMKELRKLNTSISPASKTDRRRKTELNTETSCAINDDYIGIPFVFSINASPDKNFDSANLSPLSLYKENSDFLSPKQSLKRFTSFMDPESMPPSIKLVPIRPSKKSENSTINIRHCRIRSLDALVDTCNTLEPAIRPKYKEVIRMERERDTKFKKFLHYVDDLSNILRIAPDKETFLDIMSTRKYNKILDKGLKNDLIDKNDELSMMTKKLNDYGGSKIWRYNHTTFISNTEKQINSISKYH